MKSARICLTIIGMSTGILLTGILTFNIFINPYDVFGTSLKKRPLDLTSESYFTKAIGIIRNKPNTIIIGSSIVDAGFRLPGSTTLFHDDGFNEKLLRIQSLIEPYLPIYNAGVRGGGLYEILAYIKHAYKNNPHLKHIVLGIEWGIFTYARPPTPAVPQTPMLGKRYVPISIYLQKSLSWQSTYDSFRTLSENNREVKGYLKVVTELFNSFNNECIKILTATSLGKFVSVPSEFNTSEQILKGRTFSETKIFFFSLQAISAQHALFNNNGQDALINPNAINYLQQIVSFAKEKNIKLDVYVSPHHALYWEFVKKFGLETYVDQWFREVANITPYWDFSDKIDFNQQVDQYFSTDSLHFNELGGEIILPTILATKLIPGVIYVTNKNIESIIKKRHRALTNWIKRDRYLSDLFASTEFSDLQSVRDHNDFVIQFNSNYKNFNIIQLKKRFVALPVNDAPYDLKRLMTSSYKNSVEAKSIKDLVTKIDKLKISDLS